MNYEQDKIEDIESPEIWSSKVYLGLESTHELQTQLLEQKNINKKKKKRNSFYWGYE